MRIDASKLLTSSLRNLAWGEKAARVMAAALAAADPEASVLNQLHRSGNVLKIGGRVYFLDQFERILVVGAGKAGTLMLKAVVDVLEDRISAGCVIVKEGYNLSGYQFPPGLMIVEAGHPLPDEKGRYGTDKIVELLIGAEENDLIICLISGGGSALLTYPVSDISMISMQALTKDLLACGADIHEINTLRKHLDLVKGGGLASLAYPANLATLILSDVVGDSLDIIASGPTVPDPGTYADAWNVLEKYDLTEKTGKDILRWLKRGIAGEIEDTPKLGDHIFQKVHNRIVGSNRQSIDMGLSHAQKEGFYPLLLTTRLTGEARLAGSALGALARQATDRGKKSLCLAAGGETTVVLRGNGLGGRNQELALAAVMEIAGLSDTVLASLATDGGDGPTDAAGAVVTGHTLERAAHLGLDPIDFLSRNDAYKFFEPLGDLLKPGPTLTNVNDIIFIFIHNT